MSRWSVWVFAVALGFLLLPIRCPAPLIFTPGEGWRYERVGEADWYRRRAKDQLEVAQKAFEVRNYGLALKAARRVVNHWAYSIHAPEAQYLVGRCYEAKNKDEAAFKAYQRIVERYPKSGKFDEITQRQFAIANRHLAGKRYKLFNVIPWFASMTKTITLYEQIVKNGRYSEIAPQAQMNMGVAHENKRILGFKAPDYAAAAKAYELAADRYNDLPVGKEALFRAGEAYTAQAKTAEYDQSIAGIAIATFTDFSILHPTDPRVPEAQATIETLKTEQARGSLQIARFYEKRRRWLGAKIYYNNVLNLLLHDPDSQYAEEARWRIDAINRRTAQ